MQIIDRPLTMCTDCALIIANGADSDEQHAHVLVMFNHTRDWVGTIVVDEQTDVFSSRHCDTCPTTLAGVRYSGALLVSAKVGA